MTLVGLEQGIKSTAFNKGARAYFIGYADDCDSPIGED